MSTSTIEQPIIAVENAPEKTVPTKEAVNPFQRSFQITNEFLQKYSIKRQGQDVVLVKGLMHLAHHLGFKGVESYFTAYPCEGNGWSAFAETVVYDEFGRKWREGGDANAQNVGSKVAPHFARMALTRSKGRCLRDALGLQILVDEELEVLVQTSQDLYGGSPLMTTDQGQRMAQVRALKGKDRSWVITTASVLFDKLDPRDMTEKECDVVLYILDELPDANAPTV